MAGPGFSIELEGHEFHRRLGMIVNHAQQLETPFNSIHRSFLGVETQQFNLQGSITGGWAPLAPSTIERKARMGLDPRILHATGRLRASLTRPSHPDHVFRIAGDEVVMGTRVPYAAAHDQSSGVNRPRRPIIAITKMHRQRWADIIQRWVFRGQASEDRG